MLRAGNPEARLSGVRRRALIAGLGAVFAGVALAAWWQRPRLFAAGYDRLCASAERGWMGERRAALLDAARGTVLEIGAGTGSNLDHYPPLERLILSEPSPHMRRRLANRAAAAGLRVEVLDAAAEDLPLPDDSVDTVVVTLVLCSVPDVGAAIAEIRRVLRPDGRLLMIEHVRGEGRVARAQDLADRVWPHLAQGCHPNRDTAAAVAAAGFSRIEAERFVPPERVGPLIPHVAGTYRPA